MILPLQVHAWRKTTSASMAPVIDLKLTRPEHAADVLAAAWGKSSVRPVRFWNAFPSFGDTISFRTFPGTLDVDSHTDWYRRLYTSLARLGVVPTFLIFDHEDLFNYWNWREFGKQRTDAARIQLMRDTLNRLGSQRPDYLRDVTAEGFIGSHPQWRTTVDVWNRFSFDLTYEAMRRAAVDTATDAFGRVIPATNFNGMLPSFTVYDYNGWPLRRDWDGFSDWSAPACYLAGTGIRYSALKKGQAWGRFVDNMNYVRSCLARSERVAPWIAGPTAAAEENSRLPKSAQQWLWREQVLHMRWMGVNTLLYWNPFEPESTGDTALATRTFADAQNIPAERREVYEIALDADEIDSAGYVTTYADFRKAGGR